MAAPTPLYAPAPVSPLTAFQFVFGFVLLLLGAEVLVRGASRLTRSLGVSPLVVGLTVVAFGTSSPEIAVSVKGALAGRGDLAFGNVVGSNIANILLVLGLSAAIAPLIVARSLVRVDVPIMIFSALVSVGVALDGTISPPEGILLIAMLAAYVVFTVRSAMRSGAPAGPPGDDGVEAYGGPASRGLLPNIANVLLAGAGFGMLVYGSDFLVNAAVSVATALGISELVIGLTVVAVGTSLPEIATSAMASWKGERDIAVGNVVGSNIFNSLCVLGASAVATDAGLAVPAAAMGYDVPVMLAASVACVPIFLVGYRLERWEGVLFLGYYGAYVAYLVLAAADSPLRDAFGAAMALFVIPLTVITLAVVYRRARRADAGGGGCPPPRPE